MFNIVRWFKKSEVQEIKIYPFCEDCKFHRNTEGFAKCTQKDFSSQYVSRIKVPVYENCSTMRLDYPNCCGPTARYFERKEWCESRTSSS